jgi:hypothetical protein
MANYIIVGLDHFLQNLNQEDAQREQGERPTIGCRLAQIETRWMQ